MPPSAPGPVFSSVPYQHNTVKLTDLGVAGHRLRNGERHVRPIPAEEQLQRQR